MSATETEQAHSGHPTPRQYVRIAVILGVLTALEVSTYFVDFGRIAIPLLIVLMAIKFALVAGWFMHLKFDSRWFKVLMYAGLGLALTIYLVTVTIVVVGHAAAVA